jgi:hypothetical protein
LHSREANGSVAESAAERLAWFVVNIGLLSAVYHKSSRVPALRDAIAWFFRDDQVYGTSLFEAFNRVAFESADSALSQIFVDTSFIDLVPYVLEPHGHVTRGSLERDSTASATRNRKRDSGVYYTPSDVVEFMVEALFDAQEKRTWIDPACGTAVFLREVLRSYGNAGSVAEVSLLSFCRQNIFGLDISPLATESSAFVLLMECATNASIETESPFQAWQSIAKNILPCDATRLRFQSSQASSLFSTIDPSTRGVDLRDFFSGTGGTFDCVVMNPPYSGFAVDSLHMETWESYQELTLGSTGRIALAFVEMMWKLAKPNGAATAVLPLSIGASSQRQFKACRRAISDAGGIWEFLFFDREPHALFGEDIKTRNAIVFRKGCLKPTEIHTSRMLKWTSAVRAKIFTRSRTARISGNDISYFVPKLGTEVEVQLYDAVIRNSAPPRLQFDLTRTTLSQVNRLEDKHTIIVGSSAYNFLNVFHPSALNDVVNSDLSESPLHALVFEGSTHRNIGLAILASSMAFWLWHTEGDGFHVTADFLARLPLWGAPLSDAQLSNLSVLGRRAWDEAARTRVRSVNGGKATYSFHCAFDSPTIEAIDQLLMSTVSNVQNAHEALGTFINCTTSIDGTKRRRVA